MPDSSAERTTLLTNVRPRHACNLLGIVYRATIRDRSFIEARYSEAATHFEETLAFLESMGWLRANAANVETVGEVPERLAQAPGEAQNLLFAEATLTCAGSYGLACAQYLSQFTLHDGILTHRPTVDERLRDAAVRDFFMDLGAVTYRVSDDSYVLEQPFAVCLVWARNALSPTRQKIARRAEERLTLGESAELEIVAWERARVGFAHNKLVRHVAHENPAACFDIQSVSVADCGEVLPRFIEVKAVALGSFEFHWSRNEMEAAEILGDQYFLYLLPVVGRDLFDTTRMEIIQDAYTHVYRNQSHWLTTVVDTVCRKRESVAS